MPRNICKTTTNLLCTSERAKELIVFVALGACLYYFACCFTIVPRFILLSPLQLLLSFRCCWLLVVIIIVWCFCPFLTGCRFLCGITMSWHDHVSIKSSIENRLYSCLVRMQIRRIINLSAQRRKQQMTQMVLFMEDTYTTNKMILRNQFCCL